MKCCVRCKETRAPEAFNQNKLSTDGLQSWCRTCAAEYNKARRDADIEAHLAASRARQQANPEAARIRRQRHKDKLGDVYKRREYGYHLRKKYGITVEDYDAMLKSQGGQCAICRDAKIWKQKRSLVVDHCHKTGKVRGLLCNQCNTAVGHLSDCKENAMRLFEYLNRAGDA